MEGVLLHLQSVQTLLHIGLRGCAIFPGKSGGVYSEEGRDTIGALSALVVGCFAQ